MGKREIYTVNSKLKHDNGEIEIVATKKIALEKINGKWVSTIIHEERFMPKEEWQAHVDRFMERGNIVISNNFYRDRAN